MLDIRGVETRDGFEQVVLQHVCIYRQASDSECLMLLLPASCSLLLLLQQQQLLLLLLLLLPLLLLML